MLKKLRIDLQVGTTLKNKGNHNTMAGAEIISKVGTTLKNKGNHNIDNIYTLNMKIEEKFEHILKNSIHIHDMNTIAWFYPNESELRHKKLCEVLNREYKVNLDNYDLMIKQDVKNDIFWLHYDRIWSVFYNEKGWDYSEVQAFTQERLEQHLKSKEITTNVEARLTMYRLEQHLKTKEITTCPLMITINSEEVLEQHLKTKEITTSTTFIH